MSQANNVVDIMRKWSNVISTSLSEMIYCKEKAMVFAQKPEDNLGFLWVTPVRILVNGTSFFIAAGCATTQIVAAGVFYLLDMTFKAYQERNGVSEELSKEPFKHEWKNSAQNCMQLACDYTIIVLPVLFARIFTVAALAPYDDFGNIKVDHYSCRFLSR